MFVCVCEKVCQSCPTLQPCQAPLSMEFSKQEYWRLPSPSPGDLSDPGTKPMSPVLQADSLPSEHQVSPETYI